MSKYQPSENINPEKSVLDFDIEETLKSAKVSTKRRRITFRSIIINFNTYFIGYFYALRKILYQTLLVLASLSILSGYRELLFNPFIWLIIIIAGSFFINYLIVLITGNTFLYHLIQLQNSLIKKQIDGRSRK